MYSVYGLFDPRDGEIRYVGYARWVVRRLSTHLWHARRGDGLHGYSPSEETRRRMSRSRLGRIHPLEVRKRIGRNHTTVMTPEVCEKISRTKLERPSAPCVRTPEFNLRQGEILRQVGFAELTRKSWEKRRALYGPSGRMKVG